MRILCSEDNFNFVRGQMFRILDYTLMILKDNDNNYIIVIQDNDNDIFYPLTNTEATQMMGNVFTVKNIEFVIFINCNGHLVLNEYDRILSRECGTVSDINEAKTLATNSDLNTQSVSALLP
jgi:hypothetical protein